MPPPPYFVNFSATLETLMREAKYLDRMGFTVPEKALNVTLQQVRCGTAVIQSTSQSIKPPWVLGA